MTLGVKLLATTLGVVGGGGVIAPLTLWQTGYIGGSGSTATTSSSHSFAPQATLGTCEVKGKEEWRDVLWRIINNNWQ
ncbi:hypothetical protein [Mycoplasma wenyonii]|uniref:hypothetical protein n=1 Tax=Mycoplasma wenyonii TaxID=65123 RepID=UPI0002EC5E45|nr:hypothetical protein [Mycoplasma wenyonii]